ncbi:phosphodiesterase [Leptothoe sp. LEGE 181152]|nr:phosphodiesterase [Leptothoe sp. LEGE 181152]
MKLLGCAIATGLAISYDVLHNPRLNMTLIAQISDLHVQVADDRAYGVVDTNALVANAITHINDLNPQPDLVIATGDLVHQGTEAEYEQLKIILSQLNAPIYLLPGNHDCRESLKQVFSHHTYLPHHHLGHLSYTLEDYPVRMILLDTTIPGKGSGLVDAGRLAWLEAQLNADTTKSTILFMHHPPFPTGITMMDNIGLEGRTELENLIRHHPQIVRVSCGHLHRSIHCQWAGTTASTQSSLVHQVVLDLQPDAAGTFVMEPAAYQLHLWHQDILVSHTVYVGEFTGPFPFSDPKKRRNAPVI